MVLRARKLDHAPITYGEIIKLKLVLIHIKILKTLPLNKKAT
jgi:hypothetical protein